MTCFDKEHYKSIKAFAKREDVNVATSEVYGGYNGVTVAFRPSISHKEGRMLTVSVSYCAVEDKYKRKHGKYQALLKFFSGEAVQLPLAKEYHKIGPEKMGAKLIDHFWI